MGDLEQTVREMLSTEAEMRNNPNVTGEQMALMIGIKKTAIENNISFLNKNGLVEWVGSRKNGWWNGR